MPTDPTVPPVPSEGEGHRVKRTFSQQGEGGLPSEDRKRLNRLISRNFIAKMSFYLIISKINPIMIYVFFGPVIIIWVRVP